MSERARGIGVKVLLDARSTIHHVEGDEEAASLLLKNSTANVMDYLAGHGVPVTIARPARDPSAIFHHKSLVVDGSIVCLGSSNWYALSLQTFDDSTVCFPGSHSARTRHCVCALFSP